MSAEGDDAEDSGVAAVRAAIDGYSRWFSNYRLDELTTPSDGSQAHREEEAAGGRARELVVDARSLAAMRLIQARSCLDGAAHCFDLPDPVGAVHALSRVVFEATAYAHWLSDPAIDGPTRATRAAADVLHGMNERRKILLGNVDAVAEAEGSIEAYRSGLDAAGISPATRPTATNACGLLFADPEFGTAQAAGETMYRVLSGNPHSGAHVLMSRITYFDTNYVGPARTAFFASLVSFDAFARRMGWGGRPAWRSWAGRTWASITTTHAQNSEPDHF